MVLVVAQSSLFDWSWMISEDPVKAEVKSSAEQESVEEDTEDENLLGYSDEVIIHPGSGSAARAGERRTAVAREEAGWSWPVPDHHYPATAFIMLSFDTSSTIIHHINDIIGSFK